jgi:branched-chain amino acid transport system permease protein
VSSLALQVPRPGGRAVALTAAAVVLLAIPLYVNEFWLVTGLFVMAAMVGAMGLNLLVGSAGQLSLAHAFFVAVGAYGYAYLAGSASGIGGGIRVSGLGLAPIVAAPLAVVAAGVAGLLFSPIATRLRGIYLGVASLSLVFLGHHLLENLTAVTGGFYGRSIPAFEVFGFSFSKATPAVAVFGIPLGPKERLWYLGLGVVAAAYLFARNLLKGRPGRALCTLRDSEVAAAVLGVNVRRHKAAAFVVSSMYAGLAGVLVGLAFQRVVPEHFGLLLSINFLVMIVIGGLGSVGGAAMGAAFVTALPILLEKYSDKVPGLAAAGSDGIDPAIAGRFAYGAAVIAVIMIDPAGLASIVRRVRAREWRRPVSKASVTSTPEAGDRPLERNPA